MAYHRSLMFWLIVGGGWGRLRSLVSVLPPQWPAVPGMSICWSINR